MTINKTWIKLCLFVGKIVLICSVHQLNTMAGRYCSVRVLMMLVCFINLIPHILSQPDGDYGLRCSSADECPNSHFCAVGPVSAVGHVSGWCTPCALVCTECGKPLQSPRCLVCPDFKIYDSHTDATDVTQAFNNSKKKTDHETAYKFVIVVLSILVIGLVCTLVLLHRSKLKTLCQCMMQCTHTKDTARKHCIEDPAEAPLALEPIEEPGDNSSRHSEPETDNTPVWTATIDSPGQRNVLAPCSMDHSMDNKI